MVHLHAPDMLVGTRPLTPRGVPVMIYQTGVFAPYSVKVISRSNKWTMNFPQMSCIRTVLRNFLIEDNNYILKQKTKHMFCYIFAD